jgi:hypothetical protein
MSFKTTLTLLAVAVVGGLAWLLIGLLRSGAPANPTLDVLKKELTPESITRVEVSRGDRLVLLDKTGGEWALPGKWPVREPEVKQLIGTLTGLQSRFAPVPVGDSTNLKKYGLDHPLHVKVHAGGTDYKLDFGEGTDENNRFSRPTYLRLNDGPEVVRLAPGLYGLLAREQEHFMKRRLFDAERVTVKDGETSEKVEQLDAKSVAVKGQGNTSYTLARSGKDWEVKEPVQDHADPDKLKKILTGVPDVWVERFVDKKGKGLEEFGLKTPEQTLSVTRPNGAASTLLIGKQSEMKTRLVKKAGPAMPPGFPQKPQFDILHEEYKFAKLQDNDQIFEIKAERLKDVFVPLETLRDPQLARFQTDDVKAVEVQEGGRDLRFIKDKDNWRIEKPKAFEAESSKITDLLSKLSGLQARDQDVFDKMDPKFGLEKPATIKLRLEEGKDKKSREIVFLLGKVDGDKKKLYAQVQGQQRVNAVEEDLDKLVKRPVLTYRNRRVLDLKEDDLARIDVHKGGTTFALEQGKTSWRLAAPVQADVDTFKADQLVREASRLEAAEFVTDAPKKEDLDKVYGLEKPALKIQFGFKDAKKTAPSIMVGKKREGKDEYYARLDSDPTIFVLKKDTFETLDKDSLTYRKLDLWRVPAADVAELHLTRQIPATKQTKAGEEKFTLKRDGEAWKISGPFEAAADAALVKPMTEKLADPKVDRFVAHTAKDLGQYGLDQPYLRVAVKPAVKKEAAKEENKDDSKERVLLVGKETDKDKKTRYARLADGEAIFVVDDKLVEAVDHSALDLLDRKLLSVDPLDVQALQARRDKDGFTLKREKDQWRVVDSPAPAFTADPDAVQDTLRTLSGLKAKKIVAYGLKVDLVPYGLDKPATLKATARPAEDPKAKAVDHTLLLGKVVEGTKGERYARVEGGRAVAILDAATAEDLGRSYLDYVNRTALRLDGKKVTNVTRRAKEGVLEIVKQDKGWKIVHKPADLAADRPTVDDLLERLAELRAKRVAAYPAKDLVPFGLVKPDAELVLRLGNGKEKPKEHLIEIGQPVAKGSNERFARVDKGDTVIVLADELAEKLLAEPLQFRDRNLARIKTPNRAVQERQFLTLLRKAVFAQMDGDWKMIEPIQTEVEEADLKKLVEGVSDLRAYRLVAEKPDPKHGLSQPRATWHFTNDAKEELTLRLGAFDKAAGKRAYAQLGKDSLVFLLDEPLTALALGEFRSRKVWEKLDAVDVNKLRFAYAKDAFGLEKVAGKWQVTGKASAKVNATAVSDALGALARLKAELFIADKGADPKLFGLDPPALSLEIDTTSGKRTLLVGRQESESVGYYAQVAGTPDAPVFLLGAEAAGKIVRPLQGFLSAAEKSK